MVEEGCRALKVGCQVIDPGDVSGAQQCTQIAFDNKIKAQENTCTTI